MSFKAGNRSVRAELQPFRSDLSSDTYAKSVSRQWPTNSPGRSPTAAKGSTRLMLEKKQDKKRTHAEAVCTAVQVDKARHAINRKQ